MPSLALYTEVTTLGTVKPQPQPIPFMAPVPSVFVWKSGLVYMPCLLTPFPFSDQNIPWKLSGVPLANCPSIYRILFFFFYLHSFPAWEIHCPANQYLPRSSSVPSKVLSTWRPQGFPPSEGMGRAWGGNVDSGAQLPGFGSWLCFLNLDK